MYNPTEMMFKSSLKVAWILATTRIKRTSILATALIVLVMTLTFLNLLVVRGILIGLPTGAVVANEQKYYSDIFISAKKGKKHISDDEIIEKEIKNVNGIESFSKRYIVGGTITADYDARIRNDESANQISANVLGVDIIKEQKIVNINNALQSGRLFEPGSLDEVIIGSTLLADSDLGEATSISTLENVDIGTKVELTIQGSTNTVTVVGITKSKVSELDGRMIISTNLFKELTKREDFKPDEIVIKAIEGANPIDIQNELLAVGLNKYANIETSEEYQPSFVDDLIQTFSILGNLIGAISLTVAAITVFIIIFVNALTQRKSIGILKGIGITPISIEISYIIQALFYVVIGAIISIPLLYILLVPYFQLNPLDFPFSDGILVVETKTTISRVVTMLITTGIAGYLPARFIVKQNTLDAILGR